MRAWHTPEIRRRASPRDTSSSDVVHRLTLRGGRWVLETSRLLVIDRDVMRQECERIVGTEAVLAHLRRVDPGKQLAHGAAELMRRTFDDDVCAFGAVDGAWLPIEEREVSFHEDIASHGELKQMIAEMRAELLLLRGSHQRLRQRVAELEKARYLGPMMERKALPQAESSQPARTFTPAPIPARSAPKPEAEAPAGSVTVTPATVSSAVAAADDPLRAPAGPMGLPECAEILGCLKTLLGSNENFVLEAGAPPALVAGLFASALCDDSGEQVGALLLDARAVAELGGTLLGVPAPAIEEQAKSGLPNEDCLCAATEVCNNLSGVVNRSAASCHIVARDLEPYAEGTLGWLSHWSQRSTALTTPGGGRLWLLAR
jgi:hypothetical protein